MGDPLMLMLTMVEHPTNHLEPGRHRACAEQAGRVLLPAVTALGRWGYAHTHLISAFVTARVVNDIVTKRGRTTSFTVFPERLIVERKFAWTGYCRWLSRGDEGLPMTSAAWIRLARSTSTLTLNARRIDRFVL